MRERLWNQFVSALLLLGNKLRGKRTVDKKLAEMTVLLAQAVRTLDSISADRDGNPKPVRSINNIFRDCLDKYDRRAAKYGEFDPLNDERDLIEKAQQELSDAINYLTMLREQIEARRENAQEDPEPTYYDTREWIKTMGNSSAAGKSLPV
jgi:hypothetical protein